jgi:hypothetical protein
MLDVDKEGNRPFYFVYKKRMRLSIRTDKKILNNRLLTKILLVIHRIHRLDANQIFLASVASLLSVY